MTMIFIFYNNTKMANKYYSIVLLKFISILNRFPSTIISCSQIIVVSDNLESLSLNPLLSSDLFFSFVGFSKKLYNPVSGSTS